jgi:phosphoglycolate phosphatase
MQRFDAIVFDFDGALAELVLDFEEMKLRVATLAGEYLAAPPVPGAVPVLEWVEALTGDIRRQGENGRGQAFRGRAHGLIEDMEIAAARSPLLFHFTKPLLAALAERGVKTAIITRNCRRAVERIFPDASAYVSTIIAREDAIRVKPDPEHLLQALRAMGAAPSRSLMVGDHPMDIATGKAAGTLTGAVASGRISLDALRLAGPDFAAADAAALLRPFLEKEVL